MSRWATVERLIAQAHDAVLVEITSTKGSAPRGTDAWMVVTQHGFYGTIGGGTLEWKAMAEAQKMLQTRTSKKYLDYVLGPDLGQCCGGRVSLSFSLMTQSHREYVSTQMKSDIEHQRIVHVFGAGHVGRALVLALAPLPFRLKWFDARPNAFPPVVAGQVDVIAEDGLRALALATPGSLGFIMTHSHSLDLELVHASLRNSDMAYVGVIGSTTKRARFENRLRDFGVDSGRVDALLCPIGVAGVASKHPAAIAASVVAQILQLDAKLKANETEVSKKHAM
jgi:xanthine dehydrogenase accessory factor